MNIKTAATETKQLAEKCNSFPMHPESLSRAHIIDMLTKIESSEIMGEQAHRWLGWSQAAIVAVGCANLSDMKEINRLS